MAPGPVDGSVLYLQAQHRSNKLKLMTLKTAVETIEHSSSLKLVTSKRAGVLELLDRAGFLLIHRLGSIQIDRHHITALVDRWRPETSSFHLRCGEVTITLADVTILLGLPINGRPITTPESDDYAEMCESLLGLSPPGVEWHGPEMISMSWFRQQLAEDIPEDASQEQLEQRARAIILHIITSRLFCDHLKSRVSLRWLHYLEDFDLCREYAWGSAVFGFTYAELTRMALGQLDSIGGCLTLVQTWSWLYLPVGRVTMKKKAPIDVSLPFASRWVGPKSSLFTPRHNVLFYRNELDILDYDAVSWTPFTEALPNLPALCVASVQLWQARVPLICFNDVAYHLPERVMRQFGLHQHIPKKPPHYLFDARDNGAYQAAINTWNNRFEFVQVQSAEPTSDMAYYTWYWNITRRYIILSIDPPLDVPQGDEPYIPRAPLERGLTDAIYHTAALVEELSAEVPEPSKVKCMSITRILQSILRKNRLARPPSPPVVPVRKSARKDKGKRKGASSEPAQSEFVHGPSQPGTSQEATQRTPRRKGKVVSGGPKKVNVRF